MKKNFLKTVLFVAVSLFVSKLHAQNTGVEQLEHFITYTKSFKAQFTQSLFDEYGSELQFSAGEFFLQKPGRFSWEYDEPYHQVIMSNSKLIWLYDSELEQVTIKPVDTSLTKTSMVLLFDETDLLKKFNILLLKQEGGIHWLELSPKESDSEFKSVIVGLKDNQLVSLKLADGFGQTTVIKFSQIKINPEFRKKRFEFKIPPHVDVIGG